MPMMPVLCALSASAAFAEHPPAAPSAPSSVESFRLENGLEVIVIPDHRAPVATHMLWYRVGSAEEPDGKSGIAHFLEHLMFKGTEQVPGNDFSRIVARKGGQNNAFTSYDYTAYYQRVAKEHLPLMMEMEADRMTNLTLALEDVLPERDVVLEERRSRIENRPAAILGEKMSAALYGEHPYGRPIIGWREEIEALDGEDALAFYRRFYAPDNAALVLSGDVDAAEARRLAERHYGDIPAGGIGERAARTPMAAREAAARVVYEDARVAQPSLQRYYLVDSYRTAGMETATAIDMLAEILGNGTTSRLYRALVVERELAVAAGAWSSTEMFDRGRLGVYAIPREGVGLAALEAAVDEVLAELLSEGVSEEEMERARRAYLAQLIYGWDDQQQQAYVYGASWSVGISPREVAAWPEVVRGIGREAVDASARTYLRAENAVTGWLQTPTSTP